MLPMTKNFLIKAHEAFDELGYKPLTGSFRLNDFKKQAIKTLNHTERLEDGLNAARMIQFVINNFEKIVSLTSKNYYFWNSLKYLGNELISLISDEDAVGIFYLTNSFGSNYKEVYISGHSFDVDGFDDDDIYYTVKQKHGKFCLDDDSNYSLRFSRMSSTKMVVLDKYDEKACVVALSQDFNIFLENNKTDYDIRLFNDLICIFKKSYLKSIGNDDPDIEKSSASIGWDILDKKSEFGLSRLEFYEQGSDIELFIYLAMSCFLLFRSYRSSERRSTIITSAMIGSAWANRNR